MYQYTGATIKEHFKYHWTWSYEAAVSTLLHSLQAHDISWAYDNILNIKTKKDAALCSFDCWTCTGSTKIQLEAHKDNKTKDMQEWEQITG
jgi:hypothetical protein